MNIPDIRTADDLRGRRVLLRASLNVPTKNGNVVDDFRLKRALPTITFLREQGARIVLMGHIGRGKTETLKPVLHFFEKQFPVTFSKDLTGPSVNEAIQALPDGDVLLLENLRSDERETKNEDSFSEELAELGDLYVNDAFSVSHREHASVVGVPQYLPGYAGIEFLREIGSLELAVVPAHPSLFVLGGAKFETKQLLVEKFLDTYDCIFVGGALANDFFKAKGCEVGRSLVSNESLDLSNLLKSEKIMLPVDVVVENSAGSRRTVKPTNVSPDEAMLDIGPETVEILVKLAEQSKFVLWNGPFGNYEEGFNAQTETFAKTLASLRAHTIVGGGDTVASISKLNLLDKFDFVSTGGGAMLDYLLMGVLPGIKALERE